MFSDLQQLNVLCAFSDADERSKLRMTFDEIGFEADFVFSAQDIIRKISSQKYSLCILDPDSHPLNGFEAVQIIRKDMRCFTPIVAVASGSDEHFSDRCFHSGLNDYIERPISRAEIEFKARLWSQCRPEPMSLYDNRLNYAVRSYQVLEQMADEKNLDRTLVEMVAGRLTKEIRFLFDREERVMRNVAYERMDEHSEEHRSFLRHLDLLRQAVRRSDLDEVMKLIQLECRWIYRHIDSFDTPLYHHLRSLERPVQI